MHNRSLSLSTSSASVRSFPTCLSSSSTVCCWLVRSTFASLSSGLCFASVSFSARSSSRAPSLAWFLLRGVGLAFLVLFAEAWHVQRRLSCVRSPPIDAHVHVTIVALRVGDSVPLLQASQPRSQPYDRPTGRASVHPRRPSPSPSDPLDCPVFSKGSQKEDRSLFDWTVDLLSDPKRGPWRPKQGPRIPPHRYLRRKISMLDRRNRGTTEGKISMSGSDGRFPLNRRARKRKQRNATSAGEEGSTWLRCTKKKPKKTKNVPTAARRRAWAFAAAATARTSARESARKPTGRSTRSSAEGTTSQT